MADRIAERRLYHVPRSAPIGPMLMRGVPKVQFGQRMKPKSWPSTTYWFRSSLFARGDRSRKAKFARILGRVSA